MSNQKALNPITNAYPGPCRIWTGKNLHRRSDPKFATYTRAPERGGLSGWQRLAFRWARRHRFQKLSIVSGHLQDHWDIYWSTDHVVFELRRTNIDDARRWVCKDGERRTLTDDWG